LEGIRRVLDLENENQLLRDRVRELERALADQLIARPGARVFAATTTGGAVPLRAGMRPQRNTAVVLYRPQH
jgi:MerR family transcriptional regulator/heat shock protein HspR